MGGGLLHILLKVMASSSEFPGSSNAWRQPVLLCINLSAVYGSFQCGLKRHHAARCDGIWESYHSDELAVVIR